MGFIEKVPMPIDLNGVSNPIRENKFENLAAFGSLVNNFYFNLRKRLLALIQIFRFPDLCCKKTKGLNVSYKKSLNLCPRV